MSRSVRQVAASGAKLLSTNALFLCSHMIKVFNYCTFEIMHYWCSVMLCKVREGPNRGQIEPAIVRKIPLQNISKVSARLVADSNRLITVKFETVSDLRCTVMNSRLNPFS